MILMNEKLLLLCTIVFFTLACKPNTVKRFLVTYPVLSGIVYSDEPLELETVFPRGRESIDAVPSENELVKHANQKDRAIRNKVVGVFAWQGEVSPDVRRLAETLGIRVVELDPFSHHCSIYFMTNFLECVQRTGLGGSR